MTLTDRELATLTWLLIAALSLLMAKGIRKATWTLIKAVFGNKLRTAFLLALLYCTSAFFLLLKTNVAEQANVKTAVLWFLTFALPSLGQTISNEEDRSHLIKILREAIGANALIAFLVSSYTFSFAAELVLVPAATLFSLLIAIPKSGNSSPIEKFAIASMAIIATLFLARVAYGVFNDFANFASLATGREFVLPVAMTVLYLPFLFSMHLFVVYEIGIIRAKNSIKDHELYSYAIRRSAIHFNVDAIGFKKWLKHIAHFRPKSREDVDASIKHIRRVRRRDMNPFRVPPEIGWLPETAKKFLSDEDLAADDYYENHSGWSASSKHRKVGSRPLHDTLHYFIRGDEFSVTQLFLELVVFEDDGSEESLDMFCAVAGKLISRAAYGHDGKESNVSLSFDGTPVAIGRIQAKMTKEVWKTGNGGYELELAIEPLAATT
ncbi:MAG: hypothetical protein GXC75_09400 [Xanthomonadaceae bacterium]|nr:hypothetical protein [Xanthomonadaceae bacterium]